MFAWEIIIFTFHKQDGAQNCLNLAFVFMDTTVYEVVLYVTGITTMMRTQSHHGRTLATSKQTPSAGQVGIVPPSQPQKAPRIQPHRVKKNISDTYSDHPSTKKYVLFFMSQYLTQKIFSFEDMLPTTVKQ